jgi:hypothetical protein
VTLASRPETALAKAPEADVMLRDSVLAGHETGSVAREALRRNKRLKVLLWLGAGEQPRDRIKRDVASLWKLPKPIEPPLLLEHLGRACALS